MKKIFFLFCLLSTNTFAQIGNALGNANEVIREKKYEEIDGSPYLFNSWLTGSLIDKEGKVLPDLLMKYDAYTEKLEVNQNGKIIEITTSFYQGFTINEIDNISNAVNQHKFLIETSFPGLKNPSFLELLTDGKYQLLKKHTTYFLQENVTSYGSTIVVKRFQLKNTYYIRDESKVIEVKLSKASILENFPEQSAYVKANKIKKEIDLIKFIDFMNLGQ
ncbi:MAG: hypothetical protein EBR30_05365 [Cytophagia bacterium]|nr:hypothetical protein [Cytophagia bacterium]